MAKKKSVQKKAAAKASKPAAKKAAKFSIKKSPPGKPAASSTIKRTPKHKTALSSLFKKKDASAGSSQVLFHGKGRMSNFGGPKDTGVKPDEGLALFSDADLSNPVHASLFLATAPPGTTGLARRLNPDAFYIACRWDYHITPKALLRTVEVSVTNSETGKTLMARPADWGPHEKTGRIADLSPGLEKALGLKTDQLCEVKLEVAAPSAAKAKAKAEGIKIAAAVGGLSEPRIYSCDEWGAKPALRTEFARNRAVGIVIHHTEGANRAASSGDAELKKAFETARSIQNGHFERGWSDTGQHFTVSQGGIIMEGRHGSLAAARQGDSVQAAHAGDTVKNEQWFGIEVCGDNRAEYHVTTQQWAALVDLCTWLCDAHGGADLEIIGHKEVHSTSCPGLLMDRLDDLRAAVAARRDASSDTPPNHGESFLDKIGKLFGKKVPSIGTKTIKVLGAKKRAAATESANTNRARFVAAKFIWRFHLDPMVQDQFNPADADWLERMLALQMKHTLLAPRPGTPPDIAAGRIRAAATFLAGICMGANTEGATLEAGVDLDSALDSLITIMSGTSNSVANLGTAIDKAFRFPNEA